MPRRTFSIGEAAERTGLSVHTLRFYEKEGVFLGPVRRVGGRRVYTQDDLDWLYLCIRLRASGMPLPLIRDYAALVREGDSTAPERLALMRRHRDRVIAQIDELNHCLALIAHKVALYEEHLTGGDPLWTSSCAVREDEPDGPQPGG
ncbi:MerR family transcriptional regulator [Actinomadura sediminis]|uniref:MerR family transcriptional regulator n=1 Tax=Actinomadura sediminis TaxID=1038904 RepID=A0ABW3EUE2_9ACTN